MYRTVFAGIAGRLIWSATTSANGPCRSSAAAGGEGKSAEAFDPAGPWLVTPHEVPNATVIFKPAEIVHYLSQFLVLEHGDLINTVTPPGVGMGLTPPAG